MSLSITPKTTALVLIDLEHGIVGMKLAPHPPALVVGNSAKLAAAFRQSAATVVYVHVDMADMLSLPADQPTRDPNAPKPPAQASELVPEAGFTPGDLLIRKRQWGAFYGTDLDQQLRRRGIKTIVIVGIATNLGVESTARAAFDRGYELIFVEDAMTTFSAEAHDFAIRNIFPRMGRVRSVEEVLEAITAA